MSKTSNEVIERAHRRIRVLASDEPLQPEMRETGLSVLNGCIDELSAHASLYWSVDDVPDELFIPLANYLAVELAPEYNKQPPESRERAWLRIMSQIRADDSSNDVADAEKRATFF